MKNYLILILFFIISCTSKNTTNNGEQLVKQDTLMINNVAYYLNSISEKEFKALNEPKDIKNNEETIDDASHVSRDSLKLTFRLRNGVDSFLVDDYPNFGSYTYLESCNDIDYWLLSDQSHESIQYLLLNKGNGDKISLWGKPVYSPDKKFFIAYSCDLMAFFNYNGLQLFEIKNKKASLLWSKEIEHWGPNEIRWQNDSTICIEKLKMNFENLKDPEEISYKSMLIK